MRYAFRMAQIVTRLDDDLAAEVDALVVDGVVASRSDAVRLGLIALIERSRREGVGRAIIEGYERVPQAEGEVGWADESTQQMIADQPW